MSLTTYLSVSGGTAVPPPRRAASLGLLFSQDVEFVERGSLGSLALLMI
jgi:hypothetical protein